MWVWMSLFTLPINHLRNIPGIQSIQLWCKCSRYHRNNNLTPCKTSSSLMFIPWRGETTQLASIQLTPTHIRCLTVIQLMRPQNTLRFLIILIDILICCSHFSWRAVDGQVEMGELEWLLECLTLPYKCQLKSCLFYSNKRGVKLPFNIHSDSLHSIKGAIVVDENHQQVISCLFPHLTPICHSRRGGWWNPIMSLWIFPAHERSHLRGVSFCQFLQHNYPFNYSSFSPR